MSYNNNWVRTLSESYFNNNRPTNLDEQLQEQVALNEELLGVIEALCEELGIDMEELLEDVQTDSRAQEMEGEIQRTTGKRRKDLMRRDVKEKESATIFSRGGYKYGRVGRKTRLGNHGFSSRDDVIAPEPYSDWNREPTDIERATTASTESAISSRQAEEAQERRKQAGMKEKTGATQAQQVSWDRETALRKGLDTAIERQQEEDTGVKPGLGKRISRAVARMRGKEIMPTDHAVLDRNKAEERAEERRKAEERKTGRSAPSWDTGARRTTTGQDERNW